MASGELVESSRIKEVTVDHAGPQNVEFAVSELYLHALVEKHAV
jgi:hypothetical protein